MPQKKTRIVVGLGNPGETYRSTRHNAGFMVIDKIADRFSIPVEQERFDALTGCGIVEGIDVVLVKPFLFMNRSGGPVQKLLEYHGICIRDMLVAHDDIDLVFGRVKIKVKGGHGGHNGVRSLMEVLGEDHFTRLRVGVGRSGTETGAAGHVLERFDEGEEKILPKIIERSRDAVVAILCKGAQESMNEFNRKKLEII